ncbi:MAG: UDP-N-acetylmuramate--L-alanine ligase [Actinomycetales bacterium]
MSLVDVTAAVVPADELGPVHLMGVGGAGMSGIARILLARGMTVSGCDAKESRVLAGLRALGAACEVGHDPEHLNGVETVVVSSAIRPSNPELVAATQAGLRILPRAAALASLMAGRRAVAVAGTHGKTTTTSMVTVALQHCGADPSFAIGGELNESGSNAHDGSGDLFVAEADESDGSFLAYSPTIAVVTNVEADHLDNYGTEEAYRDAFVSFVHRIEPDGVLVLCGDDPGARGLGDVARAAGVRVVTYGFGEDCDLRLTDVTVDRATGVGSSVEVVFHGRRLGSAHLRVPGRHNVSNAGAALLVGLELGFAFPELRDGLAAFTGTRRRMELKGVVGGVRVVDSYAHHPTELAADLRAARDIAGDQLVLAVFQPHLFSRTRLFAQEFGQALGLADIVVVLDVYGAREDPEPGVTGALVAAAVPLPSERVHYAPSWSGVPDLVPDLLARAGGGRALVLTLGAGDVTMLGPEILAALQASAAPSGNRQSPDGASRDGSLRDGPGRDGLA